MKLDSNITAIVTGGASGLGEATVRMLAEKGVKCGIFDLNKKVKPLPRKLAALLRKSM
jgi:NAD(P)-dependent dehydrogenase (short-subunit alcohol dehydrogenase family)